MKLPGWLDVPKRVVADFAGEGLMHWGASAAFYTIFSLPPLLVLLASVAGTFLVPDQLDARFVERFNRFLSGAGDEVVRSVFAQIQAIELSSIRTIPNALLLVVAGTAVFANIQTALNQIWGVESGASAVRGAIRTRIVSILMVATVGAVLFASFVFTAASQAVGSYLSGTMLAPLGLARALDPLVSLLVYWLLFALVYRILPDARVEWRDVALGGFITATLFLLGKEAIAAYLNSVDPGSPYGAAGSIFVFLLWIYYSVQILLIGAVFTHVWAERNGRAITSSARRAPFRRRARGERPGSGGEAPGPRQQEVSETQDSKGHGSAPFP